MGRNRFIVNSGNEAGFLSGENIFWLKEAAVRGILNLHKCKIKKKGRKKGGIVFVKRGLVQKQIGFYVSVLAVLEKMIFQERGDFIIETSHVLRGREVQRARNVEESREQKNELLVDR